MFVSKLLNFIKHITNKEKTGKYSIVDVLLGIVFIFNFFFHLHMIFDSPMTLTIAKPKFKKVTKYLFCPKKICKILFPVIKVDLYLSGFLK